MKVVNFIFENPILEKHTKLIEEYHKTHSEEVKKEIKEIEKYIRDNNLAILDYGVAGEPGPMGPKVNE